MSASDHSDMLSILEGDCLEKLKALPDESVHCCVTSPPYWGLRDYGMEGQIGLESTPQEYVAKMVEVFQEVRRVLREDGTCWVNLGDSYYNYRTGYNGALNKQSFHKGANGKPVDRETGLARRCLKQDGLKEKDLVGIPWSVAFALRDDGWYLRSDIIWSKPNPMPESVTDRPTKAHEYLFLLSKNERYYYDAEAITEPATCEKVRGPNNFAASREARGTGNGHSGLAVYASKAKGKWSTADPQSCSRRIADHVAEARSNGAPHDSPFGDTRNKRSVWTVPTAPFKEAHFATFPPDLIKPCILAGCPVGGTVLDPFGGSGTTGMVALELGRKAVLIELNPKYCELAKDRCSVTPGLGI